MELDARMLFQIVAVIASLSGAWALVKSQVRTLKENQDNILQKLSEYGHDLDGMSNSIVVLQNQIKVLSGILSPDNLAKINERRGILEAKVVMIMNDISKIYDMHNGRHPPTE
tara:strand:- start:963 stop:1301 length:339 start_codon:yes stop_codon:yes gene_type:complete